MSSGTFMVSRSIWDHPDFAPAEFSEREAFLWIVSEASWKPRRVRAGNVAVDLDRGQLCASVRFMASAWMWSKSRVDRYLKRLQKANMICSESGTGQLIITVCNYDKFQGERDSSGTAAGQQRDSSGTNYNKGNKGNKDIEDTNVSSLSSADDLRPLDEVSQSVAAYNAAAEQSGWPKISVLSKARRAALTARLKEAGGLAGWEAALAKAQASDHCCGHNERGWTANFDFLTRQSSFAKLMEGNYDNRGNKRAGGHARTSGPHSGLVAAFAEVAARKSGRT